MIELGKQYRTRDGREVRIYAVDGGGDFPNHGAYHHPDGTWVPCQWVPSGKFLAGSEHPRDLIEVRPRIKRTVWVNVYRDGNNYPAQCYPNQLTALLNRYAGCIACVEIDIDVEEGHGL